MNSSVVRAVQAQVDVAQAVLTRTLQQLDHARVRFDEAQAEVDRLENDLAGLQVLLNDTGLTEEELAAARARACKPCEPAAFMVVSGRSIRPAVLACAAAAADKGGCFTLDDLMAAIAAQHLALAVANPRVRASQILTLSTTYRFDEEQKVWMRSAS